MKALVKSQVPHVFLRIQLLVAWGYCFNEASRTPERESKPAAGSSDPPHPQRAGVLIPCHVGHLINIRAVWKQNDGEKVIAGGPGQTLDVEVLPEQNPPTTMS